MRHVEKALAAMPSNKAKSFIKVENMDDVKGVAPVVSFELQFDPVSQVGVNGCQVGDMLLFVRELFASLNSVVPNRETSLTITKLDEAIHWQLARTMDREKRGVEGTFDK